MKSLQLAGSALLGKSEAFFALRLAAMQSVPDYCAENDGDQTVLRWRLPEETRARNSVGD